MTQYAMNVVEEAIVSLCHGDIHRYMIRLTTDILPSHQLIDKRINGNGDYFELQEKRNTNETNMIRC